jgi:hypothetical protein
MLTLCTKDNKCNKNPTKKPKEEILTLYLLKLTFV